MWYGPTFFFFDFHLSLVMAFSGDELWIGAIPNQIGYREVVQIRHILIRRYHISDSLDLNIVFYNR